MDYSDENIIDLIRKAQNGDKEARSALIDSNTGLVWSVVRRFRNRNVETEDLFQIGCIGLIKAVDKFDPSFNVRFSTYAVPMILGEIRRYFRDDGAIKVSRSLKELSLKARDAGEKLEQKLSRPPTISELAEFLGEEAESIIHAIEASRAPESLFREYEDDDGSENRLIDRIISDQISDETDTVERISLYNAIRQLSSRDKRLIWLRYYSGQTQQNVAKKLGISQVQVSRLEKKILDTLKSKLEG
ncbi:MAG: SigF/SigG family RNA polymerase sporulation sigma factor [Bacillota bacterium]|jgi:RNA polymerase sporulation-specific sigma factor|nr:SigF/SigG family RNA polymerase sporulation sigma factor [Bacillota bacterium]